MLGLCAVGCYVHTYMHTYMHLGSWIFCVGSYLYSYAVVIDVVNIGSFLHHVGSYQSHCIGIGSFIVAVIGLKNSFLNGCISLVSLLLETFPKCRMFRMTGSCGGEGKAVGQAQKHSYTSSGCTPCGNDFGRDRTTQRGNFEKCEESGTGNGGRGESERGGEGKTERTAAHTCHDKGPRKGRVAEECSDEVPADKENENLDVSL